MQKYRTALPRETRSKILPDGSIVTVGIICCALAIVLVLAVAMAAAA